MQMIFKNFRILRNYDHAIPFCTVRPDYYEAISGTQFIIKIGKSATVNKIYYLHFTMSIKIIHHKPILHYLYAFIM